MMHSAASSRGTFNRLHPLQAILQYVHTNTRYAAKEQAAGDARLLIRDTNRSVQKF